MSDFMFCHACHHQWHRDSDAIECPTCRSASTEIITLENDPRHFHNPQPEAAPAVPASTPTPASVPAAADPQPAINATTTVNMDRGMNDALATESTGSISHDSGNNSENDTSGIPRRPEIVFVFPPPVLTLYTTVVSDTHVPPPNAAGPRGPPVTTHVSMNVFPHFMPRFQPTPAPPSTQSNTTPTGMENPAEQTGESGEQQNSAPRAATGGTLGFLQFLLGSLFANPANATLGDGVFSQEALDRVISQLRDLAGPGGAPPASQSAIDKLEVKELDTKMLGGEEKTRCVICVDEMSVGEKASVLPCSHFFHGECVTPWLKQHNTCPVCRRSIEPEAVKPEKAAQFAHDNAHEHAHAPSAQDCT